MQTIELLLLLAALAAAAFAAWRLMKPVREVQADQSHVATLIGTMDGTMAGGGTVSIREHAAAPGWFGRLTAAAGIQTPAAMVGLLIGLFAAIVALVVASIFPGVVWAYPVLAVLTVLLVISMIQDVARWRAWRFENRLADAIDLMVGALTAGETPVDAMASAAGGALEPVKTELMEVVQRLRASVPVERALRPLTVRYDSEGVRLFTQLLIAKWEVGGPMAPALQSVNRTIRQSVRLRWQLATQIASAQNSAILVAILPYLLVAFFAWQRPEALQRLFAFPWGPHLFFAAVLLQIVGFLWLRRLLRTEL